MNISELLNDLHDESPATNKRHELNSRALNQEQTVGQIRGVNDLCEICQEIELWSTFEAGGQPRTVNLGPLRHVFECVACTLCHYTRKLVETYERERWRTTRSIARPEITSADWIVKSVLDHSEILAKSSGVRQCVQVHMTAADEDRKLWDFSGKLDVCSAYPDCTITPDHDSRIIRRPIPSSLDMGMLRKWLDSSSSQASELTRSRQSGSRADLEALIGMRKLRLIDVYSGEIVEPEAIVPYIALSYVWGRKTTPPGAFIQTNDNGTISIYLPNTPATIRDTARLTSELGIRYLWVDQCCVCEEIHSDQISVMSKMGAIYAMATLTVIGADGSDVSAGLTGLYGQLRIAEEPVAFYSRGQPVSLLPARKLAQDTISETVWATRGWTYQEQLLSTRCVIFTEREVFFQNGQQEFREAYEAIRLNKSSAPSTAKCTPNTPFDQPIEPSTQSMVSKLQGGGELDAIDRQMLFQQVVEEYTMRELTYPEDRLRAALGVLTVLMSEFTPRTVEKLCGLNPAAPISSMCFYQEIKGRRMLAYATGSRQQPSWSWTGWNGSFKWQRRATLSKFTVMNDDNISVEVLGDNEGRWPFTPTPVPATPTGTIVLHLYLKSFKACPQAVKLMHCGKRDNKGLFCDHSDCDHAVLKKFLDMLTWPNLVASADVNTFGTAQLLYVLLDRCLLCCREVRGSGLYERTSLHNFGSNMDVGVIGMEYRYVKMI